jgi:hypothetical protein
MRSDMAAPANGKPARGAGARKPSGHGGWRPGAGRKPTGRRVSPLHRARLDVDRDHPVHVRLQVTPGLASLRQPFGYDAVGHALVRALARGDFRVVHVSVQHDHVHLIVEADDRGALARGLQSFTISMSKAVNKHLGRKGGLFRHRYDARHITTTEEAHDAVAFVLNNWWLHGVDEVARAPGGRAPAIDPYASGARFDGWSDVAPGAALASLPEGRAPLPTAPPMTWLMRIGWKWHGLLGSKDRPAAWANEAPPLAPAPALGPPAE